jgi:hypothetical protein
MGNLVLQAAADLTQDKVTVKVDRKGAIFRKSKIVPHS